MWLPLLPFNKLMKEKIPWEGEILTSGMLLLTTWCLRTHRSSLVVSYRSGRWLNPSFGTAQAIESFSILWILHEPLVFFSFLVQRFIKRIR